MEGTELFKQDATFYAEKIKSKEISVKEIVQMALTTINALNPHLNAVVSVQAETALAQADHYDSYLTTLNDEERGQLPPFYGVPILLKDLGQNQAGQPSSSGAKLFRQQIADVTDNFTKSIEAAGFKFVEERMYQNLVLRMLVTLKRLDRLIHHWILPEIRGGQVEEQLRL